MEPHHKLAIIFFVLLLVIMTVAGCMVSRVGDCIEECPTKTQYCLQGALGGLIIGGISAVLILLIGFIVKKLAIRERE